MNQDAITEEPGRGRQGQNDCTLKLFHLKEHLSETSSSILLTDVKWDKKHGGRRDVKLDPPFPFLYELCGGENYSYIPTEDFVFATTARTSPRCSVDGNW